MKCEIIQDLMPSYVDKLTSEASNEAIEAHLETCPECRAYLEALETTELPAEEINDNITEFKAFRKLIVRGLQMLGAMAAVLVLWMIGAGVF